MVFDHIREKEAAKRAALIELNGYKFYSILAEKVSNKDVKAAFRRLADDEKKHLAVIEKKYYPGAGFEETITEEEVAIEQYLKKSGKADVFTKRLNMDKLAGIIDDPRKALIVALDTERYSVEYFSELAASAPEPGLKKIYADLADEEKTHVKTIEKLLADAGGA